MAKAYPSELQQLVFRDYVTHFKTIRSSPEIWAGVTGVAKRVGGSYWGHLRMKPTQRKASWQIEKKSSKDIILASGSSVLTVYPDCCCLVPESCLALLRPSRLLCPWVFSGKNTRVGCHFLLQGIDPGIKPTSPALASGFFVPEPLGKPSKAWFNWLCNQDRFLSQLNPTLCLCHFKSDFCHLQPQKSW